MKQHPRPTEPATLPPDDLPGLHPHMLRHSCGFALANCGQDLRFTQDHPSYHDPHVLPPQSPGWPLR